MGQHVGSEERSWWLLSASQDIILRHLPKLPAGSSYFLLVVHGRRGITNDFFKKMQYGAMKESMALVSAGVGDLGWMGSLKGRDPVGSWAW